jgi:hypothetical protein
MMLLEFIVCSEDIVIIERFDPLALLQNFLQLFIKSHLSLQISVHFFLPMVKLPLYFILGFIYVNNVHFELL